MTEIYSLIHTYVYLILVMSYMSEVYATKMSSYLEVARWHWLCKNVYFIFLSSYWKLIYSTNLRCLVSDTVVELSSSIKLIYNVLSRTQLLNCILLFYLARVEFGEPQKRRFPGSYHRPHYSDTKRRYSGVNPIKDI